MAVDCREALNAGARRIARGMRRHRPRGPGHAHHAMFGPPAPAAPPACSDTDAPFHAPRPKTPGTGGPGTLGKAAGVAAATAAAGTGAGLGYRSLAGAPSPGFGPGAMPGSGPRGLSPGPSQVPMGQAALSQILAPELASSNVPSFATLPGANDTSPFLPVPGITPSVLTPGAPPNAVAEPASALILGMALLAFALSRGWKRGKPAGEATGRSP